MEEKKWILVTGATGAQGGSVASALLQDGRFGVRILTRDAGSSKARALQDAGAAIAEGDLDDPESLRRAMQGAYGVFGLTNFWEHFGKELEQGKNLVDAVNASGVRHFVYSSLANYHKLSGGERSVPHCDMKAEISAYARWLQLPVTFVHIAFYYENFLNFFPLQAGEDDILRFGFPQGDTPLAMASVEDIGPVVAAVFNHPLQYIGRTVGVVGADESCHTYAAILSDILGYPIRYEHIPRETYAALGFPGAEELANMFDVQRRFIPTRKLDMIESYGLNPSMQSFATWVRRHRSELEAMIRTARQTVTAG